MIVDTLELEMRKEYLVESRATIDLIDEFLQNIDKNLEIETSLFLMKKNLINFKTASKSVGFKHCTDLANEMIQFIAELEAKKIAMNPKIVESLTAGKLAFDDIINKLSVDFNAEINITNTVKKIWSEIKKDH